MIATSHHITNYAVLTHEDAQVLGQNIEAAIHEGWQPYGSLCVSPRGEGFAAIYSQAIVKYADRF